jgi:DNA-binding transcriptional ArsR family regulator
MSPAKNASDPQPLDDTAAALAALGHPVRFEMVRLLCRAGKAGLGSGEIARLMRLPRSTTSTHLAVLREAGLVQTDSRRAAGRYGRYRRSAGRLDGLAALLTRLGRNSRDD